MILLNIIFITSILLQFTAVYLAFRLMRITGLQTAWAFIAVALFLMAGRRIISYVNILESGVPPENYTPEIVALCISALMVAGVAMIGPFFAARKKAQVIIEKNERLLARTQEIAHLGSWEFDTTDNRLTWSDETCRIYGFAPNEFQGTYEEFIQAVHPDDRRFVDSFYFEPWGLEAEEYEIEHRVINKASGEVRQVYEKCIHIKDRSGKIVRMEGIVHDVTDQNRTEKASSAKSEFLSSMSHELRTPMNAILGFSQMLELNKGSLSDAQLEWVNEILIAGRHLMELIDEILDLSKIETGNLSIAIEDISLQSIIDECQNLTVVLAENAGISIDFGRPDNITIQADRTRLMQVLLNYLSNAIKYNRPNGSIQLTYSLINNERLRIGVVDSGYGLDDEQISRLFTSFERLGAESTAIEGTGIGLALSKKLVEMMGGSVGVFSKKGDGSTFWLELNCREQKHIENIRRESDSVLSSRDESQPAEYTILYIEDNKANLMLVEKILISRTDYNFLSAMDPHSGLELAGRHNPSLILLDINLPDMDGFEVLKRFRAMDSLQRVPVVAVSANAMPQDIENAILSGFDDYVTKPFDISWLLKVIDNQLGKDSGK